MNSEKNKDRQLHMPSRSLVRLRLRLVRQNFLAKDLPRLSPLGSLSWSSRSLVHSDFSKSVSSMNQDSNDGDEKCHAVSTVRTG